MVVGSIFLLGDWSLLNVVQYTKVHPSYIRGIAGNGAQRAKPTRHN